MQKHGTFPKENAPWQERLPNDLWTGLPHGIDQAEYTMRKKEEKRNCADLGECDYCLDINCRVIQLD